MKFAICTVLAATFLGSMPLAQAQDAPHGSSQFSSYADIKSVKQLKVVWDFNFVDPKTVNGVFNNVGALMKATAEFGPRDFEPLKIVIVSHGPELVVFAKQNYAQFKAIVDRAAAMAKQGVRFEMCRNAAKAAGFKPEDFHGFVNVVPAGPYALAYYQAKGYSLNAVGATMPTPPVSALSKPYLGGK